MPPQSRLAELTRCLIQTASSALGTTSRRGVHSDPIQALSIQQKQIRQQLCAPMSLVARRELQRQRNFLLRRIHTLSRVAAIKDIDQRVAEVDRAKDNTKTFVAVKCLTRWRRTQLVVHDDAGHPLLHHADAAEHIADHFYKELNPPLPSSTDETVFPFVGTPCPLCQPIRVDEVLQAIAALKTRRAPGPDLLPAELLKASAAVVALPIANILNDSLQHHQELDLGRGILVPIPKPFKPKGPVTSLRPIVLLSVIRKVLTHVTMSRIKRNFEARLPAHQAAYRQGRSTADGVWVKRVCVSIVERVHAIIQSLGTDLSHAFDSLQRPKLLKMLEEEHWTDDDELRMIRLLLSNTSLLVRVGDVLSTRRMTTRGSPQGDALSGILFIAYLSRALRDTEQALSLTVTRPREDLMLRLPATTSYADDVDFYSMDSDFLEAKLHAAQQTLPDWNLELNVPKTERTKLELFPAESECPKCHTTCRSKAAACDRCTHWWHYRCVPLDANVIDLFETNPSTCFVCPLCEQGITLGARGTETWRSSKHLGSMLDSAHDVSFRIQRANAAFAMLNKVWSRRHIVRQSKRLLLFNAFVMPHLLYNIGCQGLNAGLEDKLDKAQRKMLRRVLGIFFPHKIANDALYRVSNQTPISLLARRARWTLLGHFLRQEPDVPAHAVLKTFFSALHTFKHRTGAPRTCLMESLKQDLKAIVHVRGLSFDDESDLNVLRDIATDRRQWAKLCEDLVDRES